MAGSKVRPRVIGLLGGSGAGKSTVARILKEQGIPVIDADEVARSVTEAAAPQIRTAFGDAYFGSDGQLDRRALGRKVFSDPAALARLEAILHPTMAAEIKKRIEELDSDLAVLDCAVLQKPIFRVLADEIWTVTAPLALRRARIQHRDSLSADVANARILAQPSQASMEAAADVVLTNAGSLSALKKEVAEALAR